jgi:hypothetical protein
MQRYDRPCPQCNKSRLFPIYTAARHRHVAPVSDIHRHLKETDTAADIRCTISVSRTGFLPETRMILTALKQSPNSAKFKGYVPEEWTLRQESLSPPTSGRSIPQVSSGQKNSLSFSGRTAHFEGAVRSRTRTWRRQPRPLQRSLPDKQPSNEWKWHMHTLRVSSQSARPRRPCKNDCNHEPLNRGLNPC